MLDYTSNQFFSYIDNNTDSNIPTTNFNNYFETNQIKQMNNANRFSPINNSVNILELTSLSNVNDFSNWVNVKKLMPTPNKDMNSLNLKKKTLVLDLDETLVHSSTQCPFPNKKNIILHMEIKNIKYTIYVIIRPFFEKFLYEMSQCYNLYIFTASIAQFSNSLIEIIDKNKVIIQVLNRDYCRYIQGIYLKDLSIFKRDLKDIIINYCR